MTSCKVKTAAAEYTTTNKGSIAHAVSISSCIVNIFITHASAISELIDLW